MTVVDDLWYLADGAEQQAEQSYHQLSEQYDCREFETTKRVRRYRFETVARRIKENGAPYGAHTLTYRENGELLLVRHDGVDLWVLPGGQTDGKEGFQEAAERELEEEAGVDVAFHGLALLGRVSFHCEEYSTWGVLPIFEGNVPDETATPSVDDPDEEISAAKWFDELPADTRDREQLQRWRARRFDS
jgi:8-oxo-dGTP diphosphatase